MTELNQRAGEFFAAVVATVALGPVLGKAVYDSKWRRTLRERFALQRERSASYPNESLLWLHGASVGEVVGMSPLLKRLRAALPKHEVVFSTTSTTGKQMVLERGFSEKAFLLPLDHPFCVKRVIKALRPKMMIIAETEIWPNLFFALCRCKVPLYMINARISDYSFGRYQRLRLLIAPVLKVPEKVFAQTELDAERFKELGVPADRLVVSGSTKYDQEVPQLSREELDAFSESLGISRHAPCFVAGSVRPGEDEQVIDAFVRAVGKVPELQMIIAPRHPERFSVVREQLEAAGLEFHQRSLGPATEAKPVVLLDTLGELVRAYRLATVSFVGATLVNIGGHNPLEPAAFKCPVIVGPHTANYREAIEALRRRDGLLEVCDSRALAEQLVELVSDDKLRTRYGEIGYRVWDEFRGATETVLAAVQNRLNQR